MGKVHALIQIDWPRFGEADPPAPASLEEARARLSRVRARMQQEGLTHLVVYGDREHYGNILYLTGLDPRYEEVVLLVGLDRAPLLLLGNECLAYAGVSPLCRSGEMRTERFQSLSLLSQPREQSRPLEEILVAEGLRRTSRVGCAGWKYFSAVERADPEAAFEVPSYLIDALRRAAGFENVRNATRLFMDPESGLRSFASASEIAYFEYTNTLASEGVRNMIFHLREGMKDFELARFSLFNGVPLCCHMTVLAGDTWKLGLTGPVGAVIRRGDPLALNLGYWGSNICRAGWAVSSARELPARAQGYIEGFAGPYFEVMAEWFRMLRIGTPGGALWSLIHQRLPEDVFAIGLNPGHLIHLEEWLSSPVYRDSPIPVHSGMVFQSDVIPVSPRFGSTRMEDGYALADEPLRRQLRREYPEAYARCLARRKFMTETLGLELAEEVLPLSNMPAIVPPFFLEPNTVFACAK